MRSWVPLFIAALFTQHLAASPEVETSGNGIRITAKHYRLQFQSGSSSLTLELRDPKGEWRRVTKRESQPEFALSGKDGLVTTQGLNAQLQQEPIKGGIAVGMTVVLTLEPVRVLKVDFLCADDGVLIRSAVTGDTQIWWAMPRIPLDDSVFDRYAFWRETDEWRSGSIESLGSSNAYAGLRPWGQQGDTTQDLSPTHPAIVALASGAANGLGVVFVNAKENWRSTSSFIQRYSARDLYFYPAIAHSNTSGWSWLAPFPESQSQPMAARVEKLLALATELTRDYKSVAPEPDKASLQPVPEFPRELRRAKPVDNIRDAVVFTMNEPTESAYAIRAASKVGSDLLIRGWFKWHNAPNCKPWTPLVEQAHAIGARFGGGITCSALYHGENGLTEDQVLDMATRGPDGKLVDAWGEHGVRHGTLSNPVYLEYLLRWCREQIDAGAEYLFMDEINAALQQDEGFDDYSVRDFRSYLIRTYCDTKGWSRSDERWQKTFRVDLSNRELCPDGSIASLDYRAYLKAQSLVKTPHSPKNALSPDWHRCRRERDDRAWKQLTDNIRTYANTKGKRVWISGNGLARYVDLQVLGVWGEWRLRDGAVDLSESQIDTWATTVKAGWALAGKKVPVVLFHDWGFGGFPWMEVSPANRLLWMRTRGAEIYAAGGFFAFPIFGPSGNDALRDGTITEVARQTAFYQRNKELYLKGQLLGFNPLRTESPDLSLALWKLDNSTSLALHVINRQTRQLELVKRENVSITLPVSQQPTRIRLVSPDWTGERAGRAKLVDGGLQITIPQLDAYVVAILDFDKLPSVQLKGPKIVPQGSWGQPERNEFVLQPDGSVTDQWALTSFLQGNLHAELRDPPTFCVNLSRGGTLEVRVRSVAMLGAKLEFLLDGVLAQTIDLPDLDKKNDSAAREYDKSFEFKIPAGNHRVTVRNSGGDWAYITSYAFTGEIAEYRKN